MHSWVPINLHVQQIAYQYAKKGARLALVARREGSLHEVAAKAIDLGSPDVLVVPGDVAMPEDCKAFVQATVERFGQCKLVVTTCYYLFIPLQLIVYVLSPCNFAKWFN